MTASKRATAGSSKLIVRQPTAAELAAIDAIVPAPDDDAPEFTEAEIAGGWLSKGGKRIGRPKAISPKELITLRLSSEVLRHFRSTGPGWQTRIDETLRRAARRAR
ncbi:MAG: BrnA antitoxin family protein [Alphaproteobacteria bacterium]|nr:BrnA antitoxin family protein [Alphaproteobacteria bacterium]